MALPVSRNTTYAVGSQVLSTDLNDLQDSIVSGAHGSIVMWASAAQAVLVSSASRTVPAYFNLDGATTGTERGDLPLPMPEGAILEAVTVYGENLGSISGTAPAIDITEEKIDDGTGTTPSTQKNVPNPGAAFWSVGWTGADTDIPYTTLATRVYAVRIACLGAVGTTVRIYGATYQFYLPI